MLNEFEKLYFHMVKICDYPWQDVLNLIALGRIQQDDFIQYTICHPRLSKFPISRSYSKQFMKCFISKLEENSIEVCDNLYEKYIDALNQVEDETYFYKTFCFEDDAKISIKQSRCIVEQGTTGLTTWQAGRVLAEFLLRRKSEYNGKSFFELGSGVGLAGLVAVKELALKAYTFSDHHPVVLSWLCENISDNLNIHIKCDGDSVLWRDTDVKVRNLDWEKTCSFEECDFVIAADILFDPSLIPAIVKVLQCILSKEANTKAIIASTLRNESTFNDFIEEAALNGVSEIKRESTIFRNSPSDEPDTVLVSTFTRSKTATS